MNYFGQVLDQLFVLAQMHCRDVQGFLINLHCLFETFQVLELDPHVVIGDCQDCQPLVVYLDSALALLPIVREQLSQELVLQQDDRQH